MNSEKYRERMVGGKKYYEHVLVAEKALGRKLPAGAIVHHWDENGKNNSPSNLSILPNAAYHRLIHTRMNALAGSGHADWLKCTICKQWDNPKSGRMNVRQQPRGTYLVARHYACFNEYRKTLPRRKCA